MRSQILDQDFNERMRRTFRNDRFYFTLKPWRYVLQGGTRNRLDNVAYQGAAAGVRYLLPFVDHRVMDFAVSVPRRLYINHSGNRILYREAFRDLMPPSLARVDYKAFLSIANTERRSDPDAEKRADDENRTFFLSRLDPVYWKGILDLDAIAARQLPKDGSYAQQRQYRIENFELDRCVLIQNTALMAKKWRDINEQPDFL